MSHAPGLTRALAGLALALAVCVPGAMPSVAQDMGTVRSPILTIDSEQVFARSELGRRIAGEIEEAGSALAAENRRIEAELIEEEKDLTALRESLPPDEFRDRADAFDAKVRRIRSEQDTKARALGQRGDSAQLEFMRAAQPVLEQVMRDAGAAVIMEQRSVFASAGAVDVTAEVIRRIDAAIGDGTDLATDPGAGEEAAPDAGNAPSGDGATVDAAPSGDVPAADPTAAQDSTSATPGTPQDSTGAAPAPVAD